MKVPMRRKSLKLKINETHEIIEKGEYGVLSMAAPGQGVYGVPLNYVYWNGAIYFHCATEGHKLNNLALDNRVSFCIVGSSQVVPAKITTVYESAIINGTTVEVHGQEKYDALVELLKKFARDYLEEGIKGLEKGTDKMVVIKIRVSEMTGKRKTK